MSSARSWIDPFDEMSDDEFDEHVEKLFASRPSTVAVSLRIAPDLLGRVKRQATRAGIPYQTFMKGILEAGLSRLERHGTKQKRPLQASTRQPPSADARAKAPRATAKRFRRDVDRYVDQGTRPRA